MGVQPPSPAAMRLQAAFLALVPEVNTICKVSSSPITGSPRVPRPCPCLLCRDRACPELVEGAGILTSSRTTTGTSPAIFSAACFREQTQSRASTCRATRPAKSAAAPSSIGTATTPRIAHPKNAATHSAQFSPHSITRSPLPIPRASNSSAKREAISKTCP